MATLIPRPKVIEAHGHPPKQIEEYIGHSTGTTSVSIARMVSPSGWSEPAQTPEFEEFTVVLRGELQVEVEGQVFTVKAGQAIKIGPGEWVRYSTPSPQGAEYIAVCLPAFSVSTVHRAGGSSH